MSERKIKGPTAEDLELIALAQRRLATALGGRWATEMSMQANQLHTANPVAQTQGPDSSVPRTSSNKV